MMERPFRIGVHTKAKVHESVHTKSMVRNPDEHQPLQSTSLQEGYPHWPSRL